MESKNNLSTESYKGVRDFHPRDMAIENYIFSIWRTAVESFGYVEYGASLLEPAELYRAKSGEEIVNDQTYTFTDRGGREVTLRPEMTPTVARMIAGARRELSFPVRWYSIPNVFRYERPQRGRLREHFQLNCDIFGLATIDADLEIISLASHIMKAFGASDTDFEIRVSSRAILEKACNDAGLSRDEAIRYQKLLDRKDKLPADVFIIEAEKIIGDKKIVIVPDETVSTLLSILRDRGITNIRFDENLVRGFDYYNGIVFEVFDTDPKNNRALFGGGRYDGLTDLFESTGGVGEKLAAVGFGMGDVTARDFLETRGLLPEYLNPVALSLLLADTTPLVKNGAEKIATILRKRGLAVSIDYSGRKIGDQLKKAEKDGVARVAIIGSDEIATMMIHNSTEIDTSTINDGAQLTIKNIIDRSEEKVAFRDIIDYIKEK